MTEVLVIGASSGIGLEVVTQALARGYRVRAMARSADTIDLDHPKLEKFAGDALKADDVAIALEGFETVIQTLGVPLNARTVLGPVTLFSQATKILLEEMKSAGASRLISVTGYGAGDSRFSIGCIQGVPFNLVFGRAYNDKTEQEQMIIESGLNWTIARPGILINRPRAGRYRVLTDPSSWRNGIISRASVADFLIKQIDDDTYIHQAPVLVN